MIQWLLDHESNLDSFGYRYMFGVRMLQECITAGLYDKKQSLSSVDMTFAIHSASIETILSLTIGPQSGLDESELTWDLCKQYGMGYWLTGEDLMKVVLQVAKAQYMKEKNPNVRMRPTSSKCYSSSAFSSLLANVRCVGIFVLSRIVYCYIWQLARRIFY